MPPGRIYILMNPAFKGLLKIGKTTLSAEERAAQLSKSTGVPKPFFVAYDEPTRECDLAEKLIHKRLAEYRCESRREFFELPFKVALAVVLEVVNEVDAQTKNKVGAQTKTELREHQRNIVQPDRHRWMYSPSGPVYHNKTVRVSKDKTAHSSEYRPSLGRVLTRSINCSTCLIRFDAVLVEPKTEVFCPKCGWANRLNIIWGKEVEVKEAEVVEPKFIKRLWKWFFGTK